jgi:mannose/fructose/N-acetylgalactosamine-specific phosphotransferase system component IIC
VSWLDVLPVALLGGLLGLDVVGFPQAMISRPLVAATAGGALLGHSMAGLMIGAVLELIALETLPFGAARYPEWGSAATVGGAVYARHFTDPPGALAMAVLAAIATAWVGGWSMIQLRYANARAAGRRREALDAGSRGAVIGLQIGGLSADLLRGILLTGIAYAAFSPLAAAMLALWRIDGRLSRAVVVGVAAAVTAGAAWKLFHSVPWARWVFMCGLGVGVFLAVLR